MTEERGLIHGARETEHRLTVVEGAIASFREIFDLKLEHILDTMNELKRDSGELKSEVHRINGSIAQAIRDRDTDREDIRKAESLIADTQGDITDLQGEVSAIQDARALEASGRRHEAARVQGRWEVLRAQWKVVAAVYALGGGTAGIAAVIAYILDWNPF